MFSGCLPIPDPLKIKKLQDADKAHQKLLKEELSENSSEKKVDKIDEDSDKKNISEPIRQQSMMVINDGITLPKWANELPEECGKTIFCGVSERGHKDSDDCSNKHMCRDGNETLARNDLRKRITTKIQSKTTKYQFSQRDNQGERTYQQFINHIRETGASFTLKKVKFRHYYLRPERQLFTLAMMEIPKIKKSQEQKSQQLSLKQLPKFIIATSLDKKNEELNETELLDILHLRLLEILVKNGIEVTNTEKPHLLGKVSIAELKELSVDLIKEQENTAVLTLSLRGDINSNSSRLYPSITRMFMSFSVYRGQGEIVWKKTYEAKRLGVRKIEDLSNVDRQTNYRKVLSKGFNEIEKKGFLNDLGTSF